MIAPRALGDEQRLAINASFDGCVTIVGAAGSGKTTALVARAERARLLEPNAEPLWFARAADLGTFAARILERVGKAVTLVDDADAQGTFADACAPLFALAWEEFLAHEVDPEVPGLRSPNRFLESAFRLIRRLREARVEPPEFLSASLRGATDFYANPPNFADPALLAAVKPTYHDSLAVSPTELQRQYRREIDLAKISGETVRTLRRARRGGRARHATRCRGCGDRRRARRRIVRGESARRTPLRVR